MKIAVLFLMFIFLTNFALAFENGTYQGENDSYSCELQINQLASSLKIEKLECKFKDESLSEGVDPLELNFGTYTIEDVGSDGLTYIWKSVASTETFLIQATEKESGNVVLEYLLESIEANKIHYHAIGLMSGYDLILNKI